MPCHTASEPLTQLKCPERKEKPANPLDVLPEIVIQGGPTGANTIVKINGEEINYLESVRFEAKVGQLTKVILTVLPKSVTICSLGEVMAHEVELFPFGQNREAEQCEHLET